MSRDKRKSPDRTERSGLQGFIAVITNPHLLREEKQGAEAQGEV